MDTGFVTSLSFPEPHSLTTLCCKLDSMQGPKLSGQKRQDLCQDDATEPGKSPPSLVCFLAEVI